MSYKVLARKWRPRDFTAMVGQTHIIKALCHALDQGRLHHAYLFSGTRGVGKTTIARILAKALSCETGVSSTPCGQCDSCLEIDEGRFLDLIEVDAASRTGVDDTRELLDNVQYMPTRGRYKIYLIDEVHMFSISSFNALLKTLEEPPPHVIFMLATTDPHKLPITVLSRCLQFNLSRLRTDEISTYLADIMRSEKIATEPPALTLLAQAADGSMRDALSLLDQAIAYGNERVITDDVKNMLGAVDQKYILTILEALVASDAQAMVAAVDEIALYFSEYSKVLDELARALHEITLMQLAGRNESSPYQGFIERFDADMLQLYYQIAIKGKADLSLAPDIKTGLQMSLLRMLAFTPLANQEEDSPAQPPASSRWADIVQQLELSTMVKTMARHCTLAQIEDDKVALTIAQQHSGLCTANAKVKLAAALSAWRGQEVQLRIDLVNKTTDTPAQADQQKKQMIYDQSRASIVNDPHVQELVKVFDATIDENSIRKKT